MWIDFLCSWINILIYSVSLLNYLRNTRRGHTQPGVLTLNSNQHVEGEVLITPWLRNQIWKCFRTTNSPSWATLWTCRSKRALLAPVWICHLSPLGGFRDFKHIMPQPWKFKAAKAIFLLSVLELKFDSLWSFFSTPAISSSSLFFQQAPSGPAGEEGQGASWGNTQRGWMDLIPACVAREAAELSAPAIRTTGVVVCLRGSWSQKNKTREER